jgi:hypothetical protein
MKCAATHGSFHISTDKVKKMRDDRDKRSVKDLLTKNDELQAQTDFLRLGGA